MKQIAICSIITVVFLHAEVQQKMINNLSKNAKNNNILDSSKNRLLKKSKIQLPREPIKPFYIGNRIPDLPLDRIINFKDSTTTLSSFGDKLVILSFWSTYCKSCIEFFHFEDSLQRVYDGKLQIILISPDPKGKVWHIIERYNSSAKTKFSLPVIYGDSVLVQLFRHRSVPHYAWIAPNGELLAQTSDMFINASIIKDISQDVFHSQQLKYKYNFSRRMMHYPEVSVSLLNLIKENKFREN